MDSSDAEAEVRDCGMASGPGRGIVSDNAINVINQRIFETSLDLILVTDRRGTLLRVSPSSLTILGYRPEEMVGRVAKEFLHPEDLDNTRDEMRLARRVGTMRNFECRYLHRDGHAVPLWWTGVWSTPEEQHFFIGRDMTERLAFEHRLGEAQNFDRLMREGINSMPEGFAIYNSDDRLVVCNESYRTLIPCSPSLLTQGVPFEQVLRDGLALGVYPDAVGCEAEWLAERQRQHRCGGSIEQQLADGRWLLITKQKMTNGWTTGLRLDITALKAADAALAQVHRELSAIIAASPVAIFMLDRNGIVRLWNASAERVFGYSEAEAIGRLPPYLIDEHMADFYQRLREALEDPQPVGTVETQRRRRDGRIMDVSLRWARVHDEAGRTLGVMYVAADVTEQKRVEAQLRQAQKMEAIGTLTGGLAHDFNNLLGIVILNLDTVRELPADDPDVRQLVADALEAGERAAELTRHLLAFARQQPLKPDRADVNRLVEKTARLLERTLGEQITIRLNLAEGVWPVAIDAAQLESSLVNLATNARDAMPDGGRLTFATANRALDDDYASSHTEVAPGDYAMIEVSDTGCGMPADLLSRVFEPFFTTKPAGKGTGLGLSMVFGFIKQSGGHLNIYSEPGLGTTVRLYLPRAAVGGAARESGDDGAILASARGESVLVVEDNAGLRNVVVRQLRDIGYRVLEAANAEEALVALADNSVDLLFSDLVLPGGTGGYELATTALSRWPNLKVLLTSGFSQSTIRSEAHRNLRLLIKPYRRADLARTIRSVLAE